MPLAHGVVRPHGDRLRVMERRCLQRHILGDVHHHRPGPATAGNVEGFLDGRRELLHVLDQEVVLDDGSGDAHRVALLEGIQSDGRGGDLAGDDHHGNGIHVRGGDAGDGIGHSGPRSHQGDPDLPCGARIPIGRVHGRLLMAYQHVFDRVLLVEGVVDVEDGSPGIAPEELHALGMQTTNQNFRPVGVGKVQGIRLRQSGALDFRGRHVHFEPL